LQRGSMEELTRRVDEDVGRRPGFVAYEFIDCRDREMITLSVFRDADEAEASRELAQRWTKEKLQDLEFRTPCGAAEGDPREPRGAGPALERGHAGSARGVRQRGATASGRVPRRDSPRRPPHRG